MRITHVVARAFGPFHGERIELAPGMTVVTGPNESGKSSWHAATRLAITGLRRGRGRATAADAALSEQHRPWDAGDAWEVEAGLLLDDGRAIELRQDLDGKVSCSALDVGLGRDVSNEILDGTPDASRWLGLDRDAFAATVSVSQAQIMAVTEAATGLQDQMQRAAATRGTDATAAEAIDRLAAFRREAVGAESANAKGPLRAARLRLAAAQDRRNVAQARHAEHLAERARVEESASTVLEARLQLDLVLAAEARQIAEQSERRALRAAELLARHTQRPTLRGREVNADLVVAAITAWHRRPAIPALEGPSSDTLDAELHALPSPPVGDLAPDPAVTVALRDLDLAEEALRQLDGASEPDAQRQVGQEQLHHARHAAAPALLGALGLLVIGSIFAWLGQALVAVAFAGAGLVAATWAIANRSQLAARDRDDAAGWASRRDDLDERVFIARDRLLAALAQRGAATADDARSAWMTYSSECERRARQAAASSRRAAIEAQLTARRLAEDSVAASALAVDDAERGLRKAAEAVGVARDVADLDDVCDALRDWQRQQASELEASQAAIEEWHELETLLGEGTVSDLRDEAARRARVAADLQADLPPAATPPAPGVPLEAIIDERRRIVAVAEAGAAEHRGALESGARDLPDVAEAEEAVATAEAELHRVESTARTIDETLRLLRLAQERVHRDLAPMLADAVRRWLPAVSGGAYQDVTVDPADLAIQVKETWTGIWREARLLSQGTREQIYLLLRVAMAQHLVTTDETAPLLLDEVTAQADGERRAALLSVLHALSAERQVILFSHDAEVAAWGERSLVGPHDRLIRLPSLTRPASPGDDRASITIDLPAAEPAPVAG
jgi:exonuclease SbcC